MYSGGILMWSLWCHLPGWCCHLARVQQTGLVPQQSVAVHQFLTFCSLLSDSFQPSCIMYLFRFFLSALISTMSLPNWSLVLSILLAIITAMVLFFSSFTGPCSRNLVYLRFYFDFVLNCQRWIQSEVVFYCRVELDIPCNIITDIC